MSILILSFLVMTSFPLVSLGVWDGASGKLESSSIKAGEFVVECGMTMVVTVVFG